MTPLGIEIMLHYHTRCNDYRDGDFTAPAVKEMLDMCASDHLLQFCGPNDVTRTTLYKITERGRAYVERLCDMPLPVAVWVLPKQSKQSVGRRGGYARAEKLSPERRAEIASSAANARWNK